MSQSLSKIPIKITVEGKGEALGFFDRLTAPLTVGEISRKLPINARVTPSFGSISIIIGIKRGAEKPINRVEAGTIAYWPRGDSICFYPKDAKPYGAVNKIGEISEGLEIFNNVRSRTRIKIEQINPEG